MEFQRVFGVLLLMLGAGAAYTVGWGLIFKIDSRHLSHGEW